MYMNFYNMKKAPFHITPDPEFLYLSPSHKEALGAIIYCIEERKGFVAVFGEVGTGKTTIIRSYLAKSDRTRIKPIYVFNPAITFAELLKTIFRELGIKPQIASVYEMVQQLHHVLIKEYTQGRNIVLIIDEAQNMPVPTFEQLRILSNLETPKEKLLQIILVGQPELADKLQGKKLRQLNQRLAIRATLLPLSPEESRNYIIFRLAQVTPSAHEIFTPGALNKIIMKAQGSPRMLNILCDNALITGFGCKEERITSSLVKQVIIDFEGKGRSSWFTWKYASLLAAFLLSAAALNGMYTFLGMHAFPPFAQFNIGVNEQLSAISLAAGVEPQAPRAPAFPDPAPGRPEDVVREVVVPAQPAEIKTPAPSKTGLMPESPTLSAIAREERPQVLPPSPKNDPPGTGRESMPAASAEVRQDFAPATFSPREIKSRSIARTVRKGEYLSQICLDIYGFVDNQIIRAIKEKNPHISDADLIFIGDTIFFPETLRTPELQGRQPR